MHNTNSKIKIKKGDKVIVLTGRDRGRESTVTRVVTKDQTLVVTGVNQYKKHVKPQGDRPGEIAVLERPIAVSKVALVCPHCKQATRIGYSIVGDKKSRICRKCDHLIDGTKGAVVKTAEKAKETKTVDKPKAKIVKAPVKAKK
jgi:large subunit ribosomal protein L24